MTISRRSFTLAAGSTLALGACSRRNNRVLLAADSHPADYPTVQAVEYMGEILSKETNGRLGIKMYAGGQLGSEKDTLEITSFGGLDISRVFIAPLNSIEVATTLPSLPFLFNSTKHMRATLDGEVGERILETLSPHNLIGLCFFDSGARSFYNTKRPILTPDDLAGLKIRVPNSDLYVSMVKALGADATPMPITEVYQALVQGVIDGAENNWPAYENGRHFEAANHYSLTRHMMAPEVLVMSANRWNKLTAEDQDLVKTSSKRAVLHMRTLWEKRVEKAQATILASGVQTNEVNNIGDFQSLMKPVWERFITTPLLEDLANQTIALGNELEQKK